MWASSICPGPSSLPLRIFAEDKAKPLSFALSSEPTAEDRFGRVIRSGHCLPWVVVATHQSRGFPERTVDHRRVRQHPGTVSPVPVIRRAHEPSKRIPLLRRSVFARVLRSGRACRKCPFFSPPRLIPMQSSSRLRRLPCSGELPACRPRLNQSSPFPVIPEMLDLTTSATTWDSPHSTSSNASNVDLTYASPLRAKVRLTIMDKEASKPTVKEVKEQEVYMGEIPLMTTNGSFVINGTERVIVSQLAPLTWRVLRA